MRPQEEGEEAIVVGLRQGKWRPPADEEGS